MSKPAREMAYALLSFLIGVAAFVGAHSAFPDRGELSVVSGQLVQIERARLGQSSRLDLQIRGVDHDFVYNAKAGDELAVLEALQARRGSTIEVVYEKPDRPSDSAVLYEISAAGVTIRSYEEIRETWTADNRIGVGLGWAFMVGAVYQVGRAIRARAGHAG